MPRNNRTGRSSGRVADATATSARPRSRSPTRPVPGGRGELRIIGGAWRGRKLHFPQFPSLRPTPDRVRETLFNWLQFDIAGRRCLDLFAGSGALGFEALSRGAAEVVFVESDARAAEAIRRALQELQAEARGRVEAQDAFSFLRCSRATPFDVVFLDPPYAERWLAGASEALDTHGWLAPVAFVYLEDEAERRPPPVPAGWKILRSKKAGEVGYHLARCGARPVATPPATKEGSA